MDLMSSLRLLLLALAATLPGALGVSVRHFDIKPNNSMIINQKQVNRKILLNINGPPLVKVVTELQSVFKDMVCRNCATCMERAIKAHMRHSHLISHQPNINVMYYDVLNNNRRKRNTVVPNTVESKIERGKSVSATVTRYTQNKKVIALEVKEIGENAKAGICKVYIVKKSVPCSSEHDISYIKKISKKNKKIKDKTSVFTEEVVVVTDKMKSMSSSYKKREVDNSQVLESYMPSIEEMY